MASAFGRLVHTVTVYVLIICIQYIRIHHLTAEDPIISSNVEPILSAPLMSRQLQLLNFGDFFLITRLIFPTKTGRGGKTNLQQTYTCLSLNAYTKHPRLYSIYCTNYYNKNASLSLHWLQCLVQNFRACV